MKLNNLALDIHRIPALDGIRAIAFLLVFFCHTTPAIFHGGNFGVDLFFVLSGFLITSILLQEHRNNGSINLAKFYLRRALRLLPALFLLVFSVLIYTIIMQPSAKVLMALSDIWRIVLYVFNWQLAIDWNHIVERHQEMFTHLWSLSVEEQFYLLWPCILIVLLRSSRHFVFFVLLTALIIPAVARAILWEEGPSLWIYFRTDLRFDNLLYGVIAAFVIHWGLVVNERLRVILSWGGFVSLLALIILARFDMLTDGYAYKGVFSLVALLSAVLIYSTVLCPLPYLRHFLEAKPLVWIGKISYGLYLWHVPMAFMVINIHNVYLKNLMMILGTFALASISFYAFERPFLRLKNRIGHANQPADLANEASSKRPTLIFS
jgi:peptidoglycan/LPS O-acetylase OafA/YrhL